MDAATEARVRQTVRDIIAELAPEPVSNIIDASTLVDDLMYTSVALVELAFTLEDEFDLPTIDEEAARAISTVDDVCDHVVKETRIQQSA